MRFKGIRRRDHRQVHPGGTANGLSTIGHEHTIDTEMKAKRDNIISKLITLRITKAKAKENSGGGGVHEIHLKLAVIPKKYWN